MKKIILMVLITFAAGSMFGQFTIGPQIGYTASNLTVDKSEIENSLRNNFLFGVFVRFGKKIYVQPEVNWLTQGSILKYPSLNNPSPVEQEIKISTIQVPLSIGWRIINLEVVNIRILGGFTANFVTNTTINTTNGDGSDYLLPSDFDNVQWQWQLGAGVDIFMFALDVKYLGGINKIMEKDVTIDQQTSTISSKSNLFEVTLGWKIF
jgi:hypothetical protein